MKQYGKTLPKTIDDLIELARQQDWNISKTTSGHPRLISPQGKIVIGSGSSGDRNWIWDFRSRLKRAGLKPAKSKRKEQPQVTTEKIDPPAPPPAAMGAATAPQKAERGQLKELILEALRKHNRPEGVKINVVREYVSFKTGKEYGQPSINTSLAAYVKTGEAVRVSNGYYRARDTYELHENPPATPVPVVTVEKPPLNDIKFEVKLPEEEPQPAKPEDEEAELDKAMEQIIEGLDKLDKIVRKTKEMRKKLREILGGIA